MDFHEDREKDACTLLQNRRRVFGASTIVLYVGCFAMFTLLGAFVCPKYSTNTEKAYFHICRELSLDGSKWWVTSFKTRPNRTLTSDDLPLFSSPMPQLGNSSFGKTGLTGRLSFEVLYIDPDKELEKLILNSKVLLGKINGTMEAKTNWTQKEAITRNTKNISIPRPDKKLVQSSFDCKPAETKNNTYVCEMPTLFRIGWPDYDDYLLNILIISFLDQDGEPFNQYKFKDYIKMEDMTLSVTSPNASFEIVWTTLRAIFIILILLDIPFYVTRIIQLSSRPVYGLDVFALGLGVALLLLNIPFELLKDDFFLDGFFQYFHVNLMLFWTFCVLQLHPSKGTHSKHSPRLRNAMCLGFAVYWLVYFIVFLSLMATVDPNEETFFNLMLSTSVGAKIFMGVIFSYPLILLVFKLAKLRRFRAVAKNRESREAKSGRKWPFFLVLNANVITAAITIASFLAHLVFDSYNDWSLPCMNVFSGLFLGVYVLWNVNVIFSLFMFAKYPLGCRLFPPDEAQNIELKDLSALERSPIVEHEDENSKNKSEDVQKPNYVPNEEEKKKTINISMLSSDREESFSTLFGGGA